ncbi:MAG: AraC family transcriptional regulator [Verrucomicrobiae bacterium]|nr:AraC family transcriptional regulator [Verrucomicrobiae bacterium]
MLELVDQGAAGRQRAAWPTIAGDPAEDLEDGAHHAGEIAVPFTSNGWELLCMKKTRTSRQEGPALRMTYPGFVFRTLTKEGHDPKQLLADTGLTEESLADPEFHAELQPIRRFFLNAIEQTGEPHLAIRIAQEFEASFIGLPAYAAMNAATFKDALAVLSRYFFLTFPAIEFIAPDREAVVQAREFAIRLRPKRPLGEISNFAFSSALIACESLCKAILRMPKAALRGEMSIRKPEGWKHVERRFGFPIRFEAPAVRLFLPDVLLNKALPGSDPLNHRRLLVLCEEVSERARVETTPVGQVVSFLQREQNHALSVSQVARALGYSERGLRRHLERSGMSMCTTMAQACS